MTTVRSMTCPAADELERAIAAGVIAGPLREHIDACSTCRERERIIRDNLAFMGRFLDELGPAATAPPKPAISPDILPGYRLDREVARGGQGIVYEATQLETKRRVAVKMLDPGSGSRRGRRRIEREAEISASLRHPNIVTVFDSAALPDGRYAIAMEFLDGVTLDEWARRIDASAHADRASLREALRIKLRAAASVCDAVQFAHQHGVIHRDLKPANIVVNDLGVPQVVDFGIARRTTPDEGITRAGEFAGTLAYASPEQVSGDPESVDTRSDIYSLGVILYEMLAARRPYETDRSLSGAITNITRAAPLTLGTVEPGNQPAGDELETILQKALAKDRGQRYQTAGELRDDIENLLAGRAVDAKRASALYVLRKTAARHRVAFTVAAGFLFVLTAFAIAMAWSARKLDHQRALLADSLASSTIERGRLLGLNNSSTRAEGLIWPELIRAGGDPADPEMGFSSSPAVTQAAWALYELYSRSPSLTQIAVAPSAQGVLFDPGETSVRIFRASTPEEHRRLSDGQTVPGATSTVRLPPGRVYLFSPGRYGASSGPNSVDLVNFETGEVRPLVHPLLVGTDLALVSPSGRYLAALGSDSVLRLWQTQPLTLIRPLREGVNRQHFGQFAPDESTFFAGIGDAIAAWSTRDGALIRTYPVPQQVRDQTLRSTANLIRISPDQRWLAAGFSTSVLLYRVDAPETPPRLLLGHRGFINWLDFSADASILLSSGNERNFRAWDPASGACLSNFEVGIASESIPAISADGSLVALCDTNQRLRIWETHPHAWLTRLGDPQHSTLCVRFSPDGQELAAAAGDGSIHAWRVADHAPLWHRAPTGVACSALSFAPGGQTIAVAAEGGSIEFLSAATGDALAPPLPGPTFITWVGYSPDGQLLAAAGSDSRVHIFDTASGRETAELAGHSARVIECAFSRDGSSLVSASSDGLAIVWNLQTRTPQLRLQGHSAAVRAVCYSPDGSQIATGSDDWTIRLWDARTGQCESVLTDAKQHVFGLVYHPAGQILFSCCRDPVVQVWDVRTSREVATLAGHESLVLSIALSPDGRTLATSSGDRTVGLWDLHYYQQHVRGNAPVWMGPRSAPAP